MWNIVVVQIVSIILFSTSSGSMFVDETFEFRTGSRSADSTYEHRSRFRRSDAHLIKKGDPHGNEARNITQEHLKDNHAYYKSAYMKDGARYFIDIATLRDKPDVDLRKSDSLSTKYNIAQRVKLNFSFPFYGHKVDSVVVTSAGFLHISPQVHNFMQSTHYVAPLMADFNPSLSNDTEVYYAATRDSFTVQWKNLPMNVANLTTDPIQKATFQVSLHENGTILFAYKSIGVDLEAALNKSTHTRAGLSDGFIMYYDFFVRRHIHVIHSYIYTYHRINFNFTTIRDNTAYILTPLPNCIIFSSCETCLTSNTSFQCKWCPKLQRCSDSFDWHRQEWIKNDCWMDGLNKNDLSKCQAGDKHTSPLSIVPSPGMSAGQIAGIVIAVIFGLFIIALICFLIYAYRHPTSKSGMWLIEHRPSRVMASFKPVPDQELL